ncbi:hypothetical protein [Halobacterium hubeiense]|uniref:hypothetical protein n=1 Tax=Halobacterium hubeiense TaxID=1407499 RepID=UPI003C789352
MRQLDACDFCGDAADGVYEVVPASVAGDSRRLALCADCRSTLQSVVDPLLKAAERVDGESEPDSPEPATVDADAAPAADEDGVVIESGAADAPGPEDAGETGDEQDDEAAGGAEQERRPPGYGQVIRLLQNRDGAMPRDDLRALATNAYDLGGREFDDALEAAVENGDVEESPDGLRTT